MNFGISVNVIVTYIFSIIGLFVSPFPVYPIRFNPIMHCNGISKRAQNCNFLSYLTKKFITFFIV